MEWELGTRTLFPPFSYDAANEIASMTRSNTAFSFNAYASVNRSYAANGLNQYTSAGAASFSYDANGNLTGDGTNSYVYDAENKLVSSSTSGNTTLTYDPLGRLFSTNSTTYGVVQRSYDANNHVIAEYNAGAAVLRRFLFGPGADEPIMQDDGGLLNCSGTHFMQGDERGSPEAVTNCSGNLLTANSFDEYGILGSSNWGRYLYTGQAYIPDLGLIYYKARMYSPTLGRFMQTDPIGYGDGPNWYAYVHNNPVNGVDPTGLLLPDYSTSGRPGISNGYGGQVDLPTPDYPGEKYMAPDGSTFTADSQGGWTADEFVVHPSTPGDPSGVVVGGVNSSPIWSNGDGGGSGRDNTQPSPSNNRAAACAALVAKNDLAGSALDAASIIPGGGDLADVARLGAGAASLGISVSQGNKIRTGIGAAGTALGGVVVARNTVNAAAVGVKDGLEAVPGIGTLVGLGALAFDAYSAVRKYNKCMSEH